MTVQSVLDEIRERPGTGDVIPVFNPATEEQITEFTGLRPRGRQRRCCACEGDSRVGCLEGPAPERAGQGALARR